jgi:pyruvate kinase
MFAIPIEQSSTVLLTAAICDIKFHGSIIDNTREAEKTLGNGRVLAIALDTKGPEIRTGLLRDGKDVSFP